MIMIIASIVNAYIPNVIKSGIIIFAKDFIAPVIISAYLFMLFNIQKKAAMFSGGCV